METLQNQSKIEILEQERKDIIDNLDRKDFQKVKPRLNEIDDAIKKEKRIRLLNGVNTKQAKLRELALQAWECEQPTEDITTNSGCFHAVKVRKFPKLAALKYASAKFEDNKLTELRINGEKFYMYESKYEYNKPTEYTRPANFEAFLKLNSIMQKDITLSEYEAIIEANEAITAELTQAIEKADKKRKELNMYSLNTWGLFTQQSQHVYTNRPNQ